MADWDVRFFTFTRGNLTFVAKRAEEEVAAIDLHAAQRLNGDDEQ